MHEMPDAAGDVLIRPLASPVDMRSCEELQKQVWGFPDRDVVPLVELVSVAKSGGCIFGAFHLGEMIGFVYGLWGFDASLSLYHYSRMLGVKPGLRSRGLGRRLKAVQREFVLARGVNLARWTFDPLEGANATLNVAKLGSVADEYIVDYYGMKTDALNAGLPTDRLFVKWRLDTPRVSARLAGAESPASLDRVFSAAPLLETAADGFSPAPAASPRLESPSFIEVPRDFQAMKKADIALALQWRFAAREAFNRAFAAGLTAVDFASGEFDGRLRSAYLLERES